MHAPTKQTQPRTLPSPRQLPASSRVWVNRAELLTHLASLAVQPERLHILLHGLPGVGKTATALRFLDTVRALLQPDGELYADLGADYGTASDLPGTVLADWLVQLGVPTDRVPDHLPLRQSLFRAITAKRPLLVLIDNAVTSKHVRALLPANPGSAVIATSRRRLPGLALDGFQALLVKPLSVTDGAALLAAHRAGSVDDEHGDLRDLSRLCGGVALTLRVAAALLTTQPHFTPASLISKITAGSASALSIGATSLRALLTMTDTALTPAARQLYRLLGACPATPFGAAPLADALQRPRAVIEASLRDLAEHHLVAEDQTARYQLVPAVRDDALSRSRDTESSDLREEQLRRLVEWYVRCTAAADITINPGPPRHSPIYQRLGTTARFGHTVDAQTWFTAERTTVLQLLPLCTDFGWYDLVIQLAETLWNPLKTAGYAALDVVATQKLGLNAARRTGHPLAAVFAARKAFGLSNLGDHERAADAAAEAVDRARTLEDSWTLSMALSTLGRCYLRAGQPDAAIAPLTEALNEDLRRGDNLSAALRHRRLAQATLALDDADVEDALTHLFIAFDLMTELDDHPGQARSWTYLAEGFLAAGQAENALDALDRARAVPDQPSSTRYDVHTTTIAAHAYRLLGDTARAAERCAHALTTLGSVDAGADSERTALESLLRDILTDAWTPSRFIDKYPSTARLANLYANGDNHYALERQWAPKLPSQFRTVIGSQRAFRRRALDYARTLGITQILDVGCGIPTEEDHAADIAGNESIRAVYADYDAHAAAVMITRTVDTDQAAAVQGNFLVPETILFARATRTILDFNRPMCLVLTGLLDLCEPNVDLPSVLRSYVDRMVPGSVVILSHLTLDGLDPADPAQEKTRSWMVDIQQSFEDAQHPPLVFRDRNAFSQIIKSLDVVEPGLVWTHSWRPHETDAAHLTDFPVCFAAVGVVR